MKSNIEEVVNSWQENGSIPIDLRGVTLGGALAVLYEAYSWAKAQSIPLVEVRFGDKYAWLKSRLNSTFIETGRDSPLVYPSVIESFSRFAAHSTLRYLSQRGEYLSNLSTDIWDVFTVENVDKFLSANLSKSTILLSFRFQQKTPSLGDFDSMLWRPIIDRLANSHKLLVLGTEIPRGEFTGETISFAEDSLDLAQQIELISRDIFPLIGDANGLFTARIWSEIPYLCFKNQDYDNAEMLQEHDGHDRLWIGHSRQKLIRGLASTKIIEKYLQEVANE